MTDDQSGLDVYRWYAIQCKGRESTRAAENLYRQGFEIFHPLIENGKRNNEPLFPFYLFIHLNRVDSNWRPIRSTRGVLRMVKFGLEPTPVPDDLISMLKLHSDQHSSDPVNHYVRLKPGLNHVVAESHKPFTILLDKRNGEERVIALLKLIENINDPRAL